METIIQKSEYELLEESISLYLGFNNKDGHYDTIRILGRKDKTINSLEQYVKEFERDEHGYKVFISFNIFKKDVMDFFDNEIDILKLEKIIIQKMNQIKKEFNNIKPIVDNISSFSFINGLSLEENLLEEDDYYQIIYNGYITTKEDLVKYIVRLLISNKIDINLVSSLDDEIDFNKFR